ncbi:MAG TPA: DUF4062 domain-containing protein [Burkholderiaceae bacterium]|nr:DUF4062 domain-containing protein [Burkholderiaceae bacterium]
MNRPRLFVSAVSSELRTARQRVAAAVRMLGYETVTQDDFSTGHGELRQWLRDQIDHCDGLIQIVGLAYGAEPPEADPDFGRVSYTQFEFLYADAKGKKTWVIVVGDEFVRDTPPDQLDLADEASGQAERRQLQCDYIARLRRKNHFLHSADNIIELENIVLRLRDELGALRLKWEDRLRADAGFKTDTTDRLEALARRVQDPEALRRRLHCDYAEEVKRKYAYWRTRYVSLSAKSALRRLETPGLRAGAAECIPRDFLPRGFRVQDSHARSSGSTRKATFDDALAAVAAAGDAVLLGDPGAGKTTTLWRLMLDGAERTLADGQGRLPVLVPLGAYDGRAEILDLVHQELARARIEDADGPQALPAHRDLARALEDELARGHLNL